MIALIIIFLFFWTYLHKTSPQDVITGALPVETVSPPDFLFAITGDDLLSEPLDAAVSGDGNLYIADTGHKTVKVFDINGKYLFKFGAKGTSAGQFLAPLGIAVSGDRVYVTDGLTMKIQVFDLSGNYLADLMTKEDKNVYGAVRPAGINADKDGNLYLTDIFHHRVLKFNKQDRVVQVIGKPGQKAGELYYPNDVAVDDNGYIFVTDSNNSRIQVFDPSGKPCQEAGSQNSKGDRPTEGSESGLVIPKGIAAGSRGLLYVADPAQGKVFIFGTGKNKPEPLFVIDGSGENSPLKLPNGVTSYFNKLVIVDTGNNRILVYGY